MYRFYLLILIFVIQGCGGGTVSTESPKKDFLLKFNKDTCPFYNKKPSKVDILTTIKRHKIWLNKNKQVFDPNLKDNEFRANFCGADLSQVDFSNKDLSFAIFAKAKLNQSRFNKTELYDANFQGAEMYRVQMINSNASVATFEKAIITYSVLTDSIFGMSSFNGADLTESDFTNSDFTEAVLDDVDLTKTKLVNSNLTAVTLNRAVLVGTDIENSDFYPHGMKGAIYEPISAPNAGKVYLSSSMVKTLKFGKNSEYGVVLLRNKFREAGLRNLELETTYLIESQRTNNLGFIEKWTRRILFEYTVGYGFYYQRPIKIILNLIFIFSIVYFWGIKVVNEDSVTGIYKIYEKMVLSNDRHPEKILYENSISSYKSALYFSILSAFHIGWRDLNVGTWITKLQPTVNTVQARGWIRTLSGIQSLISVYLLALCVISYFGRPFG